jgi:DNA ligase-1
VNKIPTLFKMLAKICNKLDSTSKRKEKSKILSEFLKSIDHDEISPSVLLIIGQVFPEYDSRTLDVGWRTIQKIREKGKQTSLFIYQLTIKQVHRTLEEIANKTGKGSRKIREQLLEGLFNSMSQEEAEILVHILFGEMRIGVNEGMMLEAIAEAAKLNLNQLQRALMVTGDIGKVAETAITGGLSELEQLNVNLFVPLKPMLANMAENSSKAIEEHGGKTAFEYKYDGARIQIHQKGKEIRIFSRRLSDVTNSLPDIVKLIQDKIQYNKFILEGEVYAIGDNERPLPFQDLMRRFTRVKNVEKMTKQIPLQLRIFDVLYFEDKILIDDKYSKRWKLLEEIVPKDLLVQRIVTGSNEKVETFLKNALEAGHEGLMAKRLDSDYTPGSRGKKWLKIKPLDTLDVVIVAADWGSGRRKNWLSNYHLGVWSGEEYLIVGKTFKGLTDEEFEWMTQYLLNTMESESKYTVKVHPRLVVEVAFNEIQKSPHYKSGFALRFARILKIREDKSPLEADTLNTVHKLYEQQFKFKDKLNN